jgi:hypothetical protein
MSEPARPMNHTPYGRLLSLEAALSRPKAVHVVMVDRKWAVMRAGELTPISLFDRKMDAVKAARAIVMRDGSDLVVFDIGGRPLSPDETP